MTNADVLLQYKQRILELQTGLAGLQSAQRLAIAWVLVALLASAGFGLLTQLRAESPVWLPCLPIPAALVSLRRLTRRRCKADRKRRLLSYYRRGEDRLEDRWAGNNHHGLEFAPACHAYAADLNLFGAGSLFERICTARTHLGREKLAHYLLEPVGCEEALARQEAVRELQGGTALRERVALLGRYDFEESKWSTFAEWLNTPPLAVPRWLRPLLLATSFSLAALLISVIAAPAVWRLAAPSIGLLTAFHLTAGVWQFRGVRAALAAAGPVTSEVAVLREGLALLASEPFRCPKLRALAARVANAERTVARLGPWFAILRERTKEWWYQLSLWLAAGTQTVLALDAWRIRHGAVFREWLDAWAEFEALLAIACYAYENPEDCWPQIEEGHSRFHASALGHPLLPRVRCIPNDVHIGGLTSFCVVSGSNMAGKSTLLRSIGLASVLALSGAPVRASRLHLSVMRLCVSISVVDSLQRGVSRFLAEVERLRDSLGAAEREPVLFLFDEIFSGTNSTDRHIAADAVVRALTARGAIGALTTHDIALASIAQHGGMNVHMASSGLDPLDFDYLVKPGVTPETNGLAIARLAGVPV